MTRSVLPFIAHVLSHLCIVVSIVSHLRATFRDPGDVTRGTKEQFIHYIEQAIENDDSSIRLLPSAFCFTCLAEKPPRSKHSRDRDVCVRLFDHECPWVNNAVGLNTHKPLLTLVTSIATVQMLFIYGVVRSFTNDSSTADIPFAMVLWQKPFLSILVVINATIALFCITLLVTHIRMILRGMTTYETITAERQNKDLQSAEFGNDACQNFLAFLTSSGPGTGRPYLRMSLPSLLSFLMSTGETGQPQMASVPGTTWKKPLSVAKSEEVEEETPKWSNRL